VYFRDREEAARRLAERLGEYRGRHPLILAVPRGAVPMGRILADALEGELDVVLVHKLGAPGNPELAVGSVTEDRDVTVNPFAREIGVTQEHIDREAADQLARLRERRRRYTPVREPVDPAGRVVIVVDDGVATGATLLAALRGLRKRRPAELVAAIAVAPPATLEGIRAEADRVVCLASPEPFLAVGQFFRSFPQVSDDEVVAILEREAVKAPA
jgi:putative phosphoribosyl transferase